jgi:predicted 3-demethylubiquinone-9 3-methyltransferase (glyoxalase superfamily)
MNNKISTCLWFDKEAEEAVKYYTSIFKNSKIHKTTRYGKSASEAAKLPEGTVLTVSFELEDRQFLALNGGPMFKFTEAISLIINCKDQEEIDYYWNTLTSDGGEESMCGWLKDKYGLSWQITPDNWEEIHTGDPEKSEKAMGALMQMKKIDIAEIEKAMNS